MKRDHCDQSGDRNVTFSRALLAKKWQEALRRREIAARRFLRLTVAPSPSAVARFSADAPSRLQLPRIRTGWRLQAARLHNLTEIGGLTSRPEDAPERAVGHRRAENSACPPSRCTFRYRTVKRAMNVANDNFRACLSLTRAFGISQTETRRSFLFQRSAADLTQRFGAKKEKEREREN